MVRSLSLALAVGALATVVSTTVAAPALAATGYVRVSQIGYETGLAARAYLMSTSAVSGVKFKVVNSSGATIASGTVGSELGGWGSYSVYPIDFTVRTAGTYTVSVSGDVAASSPKFPIQSPASLYAGPLGSTLSFYQNERDGSNYLPSKLRTAAGHLNDASATVYESPSFDSNDNITAALKATGATINAEGGWWDAGDYLKFVETTSYTVALMEIGIRDFPNQMGAGSAKSNFTAEARFGLDWLQQMWDQSSQTLYYQVGIGTDFTDYDYLSDHDIWRLPQVDDTYDGTNPVYQYIRHRPVFLAGTAKSKISPNIAGRLAADFALCYRIFKASDAAYANQCLLEAETIFDLADTSPSGNLLTTAPYDFYPEVEWRDDLELGAAELYFAVQSGDLPSGLRHTDASYYLAQSANWAKAYINGPNDQTDTLNLYDVSGLAHFELYRAVEMAGNPSLAISQADLVSDLENQLTAGIAAASDPAFGSGFNWSYGDTTSHLAGISVMAKELAYLTGSSTYETESRRWLANTFGANAWGSSFIIGVGSTFPDCPQHQVANIVGSLTGGSPVLAGAAVEGPNTATSSGSLSGMKACPPKGGDAFAKFGGEGAVYQDNVQSYTTTEPAIDLTATSMLIYSWRIAGAPTGTP